VIVWVREARSLDDVMRTGWNADMMCSALQDVVVADMPRWLERWLLLDTPAFALGFRAFSGTG